ncbi:MAG TPA: pyridine nucleotide-disulfide oxidoreductase, partial [Chitinophagaceae bacterium]|nr:pyridine nucleotide-disulfide oxidoreductase [Chitinophagaceae bacterium]
SQGYKVVVFEKEGYPFHKVCGEYISMESWNFLERLGIPLTSMQLPHITELQLTAPNGTSFTTPLPLGGFGISRYKLDEMMALRARECGVLLLEHTRVDNVHFENDNFQLQLTSKGDPSFKHISAAVCCAAFGKRSNLDVKWKRSFVHDSEHRMNNYIAVKYHVKTTWPAQLIALHNFRDGYCGISKIEGDVYCLCYLTTAANLKVSNNSIADMEKQVLFRNPALRKIFDQAQIIDGFPITIAQVSFSKKPVVENHVLMLGDAAGMITPLCGNGMSMALHAGLLAANNISHFLAGSSSRSAVESSYKADWNRHFANRLKTGRLLQRFFGAERMSNAFVNLFKEFPFLAKTVIRKTHGQPF